MSELNYHTFGNKKKVTDSHVLTKLYTICIFEIQSNIPTYKVIFITFTFNSNCSIKYIDKALATYQQTNYPETLIIYIQQFKNEYPKL